MVTRVVSDKGVEPGLRYGGPPWKALLDDTITPGGPPVNVNVTSPNGSVDLTFSGTAGERVFVQITNVNISGFEVVSLLDTGLGTLKGSGVVTNSTNPNFVDTATLPSNGTYTIRTELFGGGTGSSTITLYDVPADASGPITPGGASVTAVTSSIGQNAAYTFTGTRDQRVALNIAGVSFTSGDYEIVTIYAPGQTVGEGQGIAGSGVVGAGQHNFIDTLKLPSTGTYTVFVDPHGVATASSTTLTLYDVPPDPGPPITLNGAAVPVTLGTAGQNAYLPFTGFAHEPVKVSWPDSTFATYQVRVLQDDKQTVVAATPLLSVASSNWTATLPTDGTYYVQVDPYQDSTGSITLSLMLNAPFVAFQQTFGVICDGRGINALAASVCTADPVNSLTGAFTTSQTDLTEAAIGVSFTFDRSYTSADTTSGRLGPGWTDSYATSLAVQPNGDVLVHGDEGQEVYYAKQPDGSFVGAGGALSTLTLVSGTYKLVTHEQVTYQFNSSGVLQSEVDRNGQGLTFAYTSGNLTTITDAAGHQMPLAYNGSLLSSVGTPDGRNVAYGYTNGRLTSVTLPDPDGAGPLPLPIWHYTYDANGRLWQVIDPNNKTQITNVYDPSSGRVTDQTDARTKTTHFAWDAPTQTATITDPDNHIWKDIYVNNVLNKRIDPGGDTTTFGHDTGLNTTSVQSPNGTDTTSMGYQNGNLTTATAPVSLGSVQKIFTYDAQNNVRTVTDARTKQTVYGYDANGNNNAITLDGQPVFGATYNAQGQMLISTDGNQKQTTYTYDAAGNVASVTAPDPDGPGPLAPSKTTYTYDAMGNVLTKVDPLGNCTGCNPANYTTTYTYDQDGHLLTESDELGHTTATYTYDAAGNQLTVKDANNHITTNNYDNANNLIQVTAPDPDGAGPLEAPVTKYTYDDAGNRVTMIDPLGNCSGCNAGAHTTTYAYDQNNRLASSTTPKGEKTTYTYDANGNLATMVDPRGNVTGCGCASQYTTSYTYDAAGRLLTTTDPLNHVTTNHYDAAGNLDWTKDANNHQTNFTLDAAGRILTIQAPDGGLTTNTYDGNGNLKTRKDDNNHQTTYTYDDAGRLTQITGPNPGSGAPVTSYTYDLNGNLASVTDPNGNATPTQGDGTTTYTYDRANRLTNVGYSDSTPAVGFGYDNAGNRTSMTDGSGSVSYGYDNLDRLTSVTRGANTFSYTYNGNGNVLSRTYPDSTQISYGYDEDNRLSSVTSGGVSTSYQYDPASHLTTTTLPSGNGYVETRSYDNAGRLTEVKNVKGGTTLSDFVSTLDPVGNPTQIVQTGAVSSTQTYTYDVNDRILSVCFLQAGTCPRGSDPFIRWTYDKVGNRVTEARPTGTTNYTYNALDELTQAGSAAYTYDADGNERTAGSTTLSYDLANRLKTLASGSTTTTYSYDGDGNRLQASTGTQASKKTNYLWDTTFDLPQLALERDGNNALLRRYIYGARRISMFTGGASYYYHYDALGSVRNVTSSTGGSQWTDTYEPYGAIRTETKNNNQAPANFMKFTGEYNDPTGLYYLNARQYDPTTGRLNRVDPASGPSVDPSVAAYVYAGDKPTVMVDPSGETLAPADAGPESADLAASSDLVLAADTGVASAACAGRSRDFASVRPTAAGVSRDYGWVAVFEDPGSGGFWSAPEGAKYSRPNISRQTGRATGKIYAGGSGGYQKLPNGEVTEFDTRVASVRRMNGTDRYPGGYLVYLNESDQAVDPFTGRTITRNNPLRHIPLRSTKIEYNHR